jgi:hypothetical protein
VVGAAMMVGESRLLQVTIFDTLQQNLGSIDFSVLLIGVMTIADEMRCLLDMCGQLITRTPTSAVCQSGDSSVYRWSCPLRPTGEHAFGFAGYRLI